MGLGNFFDDVLGLDPNGGGIMPFLGPIGALAGGLFGGPQGAMLGGQLGGLFGGMGGGNGFGGVDPKYLGDYVAELKKQQDAARAKNEERYGEILGNLRGIKRQTRAEGREALGYLRGQRKEAKQQNAERFNNLGTSINQDLVSRGLSNTSARADLQLGLEGERRRAVTDIDNTYNRQLLAQKQYNQGRVDLARSAITGFKERREDAYPDLSGLQSLAAAYGSAEGAAKQQQLARLQGALQGLGMWGQRPAGGSGGGQPYYSPPIAPTPGYSGLPWFS